MRSYSIKNPSKAILFKRSARGKLSNYKWNCKARFHREWKIDNDTAIKLMMSPCHYCERIAEEFSPNGIDRVDNNKDFTADNVVPCCKICNLWKSNMTIEEFMEHIKRLSTVWLKRGFHFEPTFLY